MKICSKCRENKELKEFYKNGKESCCKACSKKKQHLYSYPNQSLPRGQKSSEKRKETQARYRDKNREKIRAGQRKWVRENLPKVLARTNKYQAAKHNATPPWLTSLHLKQIEATYIKAAELGKSHNKAYEVDHIVPICGKNVSGIHVPWNLQILERNENRNKHNKY